MGKRERIEELCKNFRIAVSAPDNDYLKSYRDEGGRILGTLYGQVPEEIIEAAGLLPVRVRATGSLGSERADSRFTQVNCSLVKHFYDSAVKGRFDFLSGIVATNACDHIRKLEENWSDTLAPDFSYLICFPKRKGGDLERAQLSEELRKFIGALECHYGVTINNEALNEAIAAANRTRALQMQLYELRERASVPPISGTDALAVNVASTCMPRPQYNEMLAELVSLCAEETAAGDGFTKRLAIYGGELDSLEFMEALESQGAVVVTDSLGGFGRRGADMQIPTEGDPIDNIARAYLQIRPPEPRLHGTRSERWTYLEEVGESARVDGYVQVHIPLCDHWGYERAMFDTEADAKGLPILDLSTEYVFSTPGQTRTRVQAFVEQLAEEGR